MDEEPKAARADWSQFLRFVRQVNLDWPLIVVGLVVGCVYYGVTASVPQATAQLLAGDFSTEAIMGCVGLFLLQLLLNAATSLANTFASARSTRNARKVVWAKMMGVKTSFYRDNTPEQLLSAVTSDTKMAVDNIVLFATSSIPMVFYMFLSLGIVSGYNLKLLMTLLVMIPVNILYAIFVGKWQFKTNFRIQSRIGELTGYLSEHLKNLALIKAFVNEEAEDANGQRAITNLYDARKSSVYINGAGVGYMSGTEVISMVAAVLIASGLLASGELTLEGWMAFYLYMPKIGAVLRQVCNTWITLKSVQGYAARLGRIIDAPQEELEEAVGPVRTGDIAFRDVSFSYDDGTEVLHDVTFQVPAGKVTSIVGRSGSGKSTILNLIERLYVPDAGKVTLAGEDVESVGLASWRRSLAYIPQGAGVFGGTLRQVVTYGVPREVSGEELERACRLVGIHDYIASQPQGYDSPVAAWGNSLSGGQRQRLVIAREVLKDADVLLFDEPTSALDASTTREIQDVILRVFKGKTIVMVSHYLPLACAADHVIMVDKGQVLASGTHQELMRSCAAYRGLVDEQTYQEVCAR